MSRPKFEFQAGAAYAAWTPAGAYAGTFSSAQAEIMSESAIYSGLRWEKLESKSLEPFPKGVAKAKKDKAEENPAANEDERDIEPFPADRED